MVTHAGARIKLRKGTGSWTHGHFNRVTGSPAVGWCLNKSLKEVRELDVRLWQRAFQTEGVVYGETLNWEHAWYLPGQCGWGRMSKGERGSC